MTNEEKEVEETEEEIVDEVVDDKVDDEIEEETTDWEAKFKEEEGRRKRAETKLSKNKKEAKPSSELDYGKKAFLVASGIKGSKETELVEKIVSDTGKTIEQVLESKYFQAELSEMRELGKTEDALPKGSKRSGKSTQDTVEYWIAKGELPTDRKLRQDVVNARIKKETDKSVFE